MGAARTMETGLLHLAAETPVAKGGNRVIYAHPTDRRLLVKVLTERHREEWGRRSAIYRRLRPSGPYRYFLRELDEYVMLHAAGDTDLGFVNPIIGITDSDLGLAVITRAIFGPDGEYAPTLKRLALTGAFTPELARKLDEFLERVLRSSVVVGDLSASNILYGSEDGNAPRFVLIDGMGEKNFIPVSSLSAFMNRRTKLRKMARLRRALERSLKKARAGEAPAGREAPRWALGSR